MCPFQPGSAVTGCGNNSSNSSISSKQQQAPRVQPSQDRRSSTAGGAALPTQTPAGPERIRTKAADSQTPTPIRTSTMKHCTDALSEFSVGTSRVGMAPDAEFAIDVLGLQRHMFTDNIGLRLKVLRFMVSHPVFVPRFDLSLPELRAITFKRLQTFARAGFIDCIDIIHNPKRFAAVMECLHLVDYSLSIKGGVHWTLCGGTIAKLGTERHHHKYLPKINSGELPGCFAMTELAHGSNVMAIETTATYDPAAQVFILQTPHDAASKFWIGGAAQHGKICTVFAQLHLNGKSMGIHVFVVRLRDDHGKVNPGIRIEDNGSKMGLNGVDNGRIWFEQVRVDREDMLDKYAQVSPQGLYSSPLPTVAQRFGVMVGGLTTGRILIAQAAVDASKLGITIASRYGAMRKQFGEKRIIEYLSHQRRLIPSLAETFGLHFAMIDLIDKTSNPNSSPKETHVLSSGLKAVATWTRIETLQKCRECCGGMGFLAVNQIGPMICDMNVDVTFEGDNSVLMQQVSKSLLKDARTILKNFKPTPPTLTGDFYPDYIQFALHFRMQALLARLAGKIGHAAKVGCKPEDAFDDNLDLVLAVAWAFTEAHIFEVFTKAAQSAGSSFRQPLVDLCLLYGIGRLEKDAAFFLGAGCLSPKQTLEVHERGNVLCRKLGASRGQTILELCNGFAIPEEFITAPISRNSTTFPSTAQAKL